MLSLNARQALPPFEREVRSLLRAVKVSQVRSMGAGGEGFPSAIATAGDRR